MKLNELKYEKLFNNSYILTEDFEYQVGKLLIRVPKGFVTDFASIPFFLWAILPPRGKYDEGAVVHDFLYSSKNCIGINRKLADKIFKHIMKECGVNCFYRNALYLGVRKFGSVFFIKEKDNGLEAFDDEVLINHTEEAKKYYEFYNKLLEF